MFTECMLKLSSQKIGEGGQQTANKRLPWITLEVQKMKQVKNQGMEEISEALKHCKIMEIDGLDQERLKQLL